MEKLFQQVWMHQPQDVRNHLQKVFNITRTGITEIRDQEVITDGYTNTDLETVTADKMSAYVGSPTGELSFSRLWEIVLSKVKSELHPPIFEIQSSGIIVDINPSTTPSVPEKRYCDTCVSTKGRHRKGCPKYK